jgi:hypothetical protein
LQIKSSLFAFISCTSLWYWAKAPSSLDCNIAECFLALLSSFSSASARSTVSPYPGAYQIFVEISPRHPAQGNNYYLCTQLRRNSTTQGYCHIPSSTVRSGTSSPSSGPPLPGR